MFVPSLSSPFTPPQNFFSFAPQSTVVPVGQIPPNTTATAQVGLIVSPSMSNPAAPPTVLQVALKTGQLGVVYFVAEVPNGVV